MFIPTNKSCLLFANFVFWIEKPIITALIVVVVAMSSVQKKAEAMTKVPEPVILVEEPSLSCWTEEKNNKEPQTIVVKQEDGKSRILATQQLDSNEAEDDEEQIRPDTNLLCPNSLFDGPQRRKHSLPSLQISEGIMASQVRRLSDAGAEGGSSRPHLSRQDMTFLSTLSQLPSTAGSGRRHSVVTFSNMQPTVFGRNRRESVSGVTGRYVCLPIK